ncbi:GNAT family N-acetyltransferase [Mammaliicoccus sciuri]|uniref:GNAT family N-acetyltransferase n=1 Tax=Mammaliicoccus sciuri TaxID=1296 RepID=UPI0013310C1D|nr:GNAT family N-acetyltransferase [Mammaliicoccus sciuri]MCJ1749538.1 GNAT family N-acetyltransferase [Mammaliicoccus sciuri]
MITLCEQLNDRHYELLALADDNQHAVNDYATRGQVYVYQQNHQDIGIAVGLLTRPNTYELVNLAVDPQFQNQGIGRLLIDHMINEARNLHCHTITVGTGNSGIGQLKLYQQAGFRMKSIDIDYFVKYYEEPIFENGIQCKDMVRLELEL